MPIETDNVMGCMCFLVESKMLKDFEGLGSLGRKEKDRFVSDMRKLYTFGRIESPVRLVSEESDKTGRLGVDYFVPVVEDEEKQFLGNTG